MRLLLSIAASALFATSALAIDLPDPKSPNYRELPLNIADKGTIYQTIKTSKTEVRDGKTKVTSSHSRYRNDFTATDAGYKVKKTLVAFTVTGADGQTIDQNAKTPEAIFLKTLTGAFAELTYIGDEGLAPQRLEDWPNLWKSTRALIGATLRADGKTPTPETEAQVMGMMDKMFGNLTPEQAAQTFLQPDTMIAMPHNLALEINKPLSADSEIIVPLGNYPLTVSETFVITHWNAAGNTAQVTYDYRPQPESLKAFMYEFLPKFLKDAGAPAAAIAEMEAAMKANPGNVFDISTHCDYDMAIDTGLVRQGKCTRITTVSLMGQSSSKTEIYDFTESFVP
ncbi:hypothetical protein PQU92_04790 [Asticcacaulis sp. BYS171W]|uniref:Uncharacterized protein n=1 Tax=Asticcacaulis aquaticus TaxID=2984212 RepID=A0ABT5HR91_9CAUL|nr:hypothetical protein [Asticcacaulis aquaticus]MDC7682579.1 hypothetical protein [Asticcacaulis aquaticus]